MVPRKQKYGARYPQSFRKSERGDGIGGSWVGERGSFTRGEKRRRDKPTETVIRQGEGVEIKKRGGDNKTRNKRRTISARDKGGGTTGVRALERMGVARRFDENAEQRQDMARYRRI
jgi:hypothetical protein